MAGTADPLPDDKDALKAALIETRAKLTGAEALIEHLQLVIAKMKREMFGPRSERSQRLLDQLELELEELATARAEDEARAETAGIEVQGFIRRKATRRDFPADLPRRRVVHPAPASGPCCGSSKLSKIGEDITETLDVVPRQWFVTEHVREKFSCRACEKITQPPAPFHVIARGFAGASLLAIAATARNRKSKSISPIAFEAVQKFDAIFAQERAINGSSAEARMATRQKDIAPLVNDLIDWMRREPAKLSRHNEVAKAMDYMLKRIDVFTRFLEDGRICLSNNAAERQLRGIALCRKSWLFAGSDRGGERAAVMLTLIQTAKLNDVDPQAWLADVLARINDHAALRLDELLPWNWRKPMPSRAEAA
jgi:hypothetical protein